MEKSDLDDDQWREALSGLIAGTYHLYSLASMRIVLPARRVDLVKVLDEWLMSLGEYTTRVYELLVMAKHAAAAEKESDEGNRTG